MLQSLLSIVEGLPSALVSPVMMEELTEIEKGGTERQTEKNQVINLKHLGIIHMPLENK